MKLISILAPLLMLTACATQDPSRQGMSGDARSSNPGRPRQIGDTISTPLNDLNITQIPIPGVLREAQVGAYLPPADHSCASLAAQVLALDAVLAADLDARAPEGGGSNADKAGDAIGNASVSLLKRTIEGFMPFRNWVRTLSGAERHTETMAAAVAAGTVRRAYLKGLGQAYGCPPPASPALVSAEP
jgi:hypothetical protein